MTEEFKINILSHTVKVTIENPVSWAENGLGRADIKDMTIRINSTCSQDMQKSTFLHEVLHIICDLNSIELKEERVDAIALGMFSFLRENPEVVKEIMGK